MNRRNQILAALLIGQLIVGVLALVLPVQATQTQSRPLLEQLTDADVTAFTIREQPDNEVRIARKDDQWVLPDVDDYPVDKTKVTELLSKLTSIQVGKPVLTTAGGHARLQVAEDAFNRRVDLATNKGERTLFFGQARGGSAHVRVAGSDEVFLTTRLAPYDIASDLSSWINAVYFTSTQQEIGRVAIANITGTLEFQRNLADAWELKGLAASETFDPGRLETILTRVSSLYMTRPLGKVEKPEYGLSRPTAVLTLTLKSDISGLQPLVLKVGARNEADNTYVVKSSGSPWYAHVNAFVLEEIINARREDFLQPPATPTPEATTTPAP